MSQGGALSNGGNVCQSRDTSHDIGSASQEPSVSGYNVFSAQGLCRRSWWRVYFNKLTTTSWNAVDVSRWCVEVATSRRVRRCMAVCLMARSLERNQPHPSHLCIKFTVCSVTANLCPFSLKIRSVAGGSWQGKWAHSITSGQQTRLRH